MDLESADAQEPVSAREPVSAPEKEASVGGKRARKKIVAVPVDDDDDFADEENAPNLSQSEEEPHEVAAKSKRARKAVPKSKGKRKARDDDDDDDDDDDADDDDDDDDFDEDARRGKSKSKGRGGKARQDGSDHAAAMQYEEDEDDVDASKAEVGQISKIELENFMNHRKFTMNFAPNLNFITGRNGSGKSAIATAIMLCLGSGAGKTGRATNLAQMIREGSPGPAVVRVTLRNEGDSAYQPNVFGNRIVIERTISKTAAGGASGGMYLLDSKLKRIAGTSKKDVMKILEAFSIKVENPCCVLTQEMSKKFIQGKETDKYDFFLKATGLEEMTTKNREVSEHISAAVEKMTGFEETLESKKEDAKRHQRDLNELQGFDEMDRKNKELECKIHWLRVKVEVEALEQMEEQLANLQAEVLEAQEDLAKAENAGKGEANVDTLKTDAQEATDALAQLEEADTAAQQELKAMGKRIGAQETVCNQLQDLIREHTKRLKDVRKDLLDMRAKAMAEGVDSEQNLLRQLETIEGNITQARETESAARQEQQRCQEERANLKDEVDQNRKALASSEAGVKKLADEIRQISGSEGSAKRFGEYVPQVLQQIKADLRLANACKGPVGNFIKIKKGCEKFEAAIERCLINIIPNFVVPTDEARVAMINILNRNHGQKSHVITSYANAAAARYPVRVIPNSLLDMLVIDDDQIFNVVIDAVHPETIIMCKDMAELEQTYTKNRAGGGLQFSVPGIFKGITMDKIVTVTYSRSGNKSNEPYREPCRRLLVSDMTEVVNSKKEELRRREAELNEKRANQPDTGASIRQLDAQYQAAAKTIQTASDDIKKHARSKNLVQGQLREVEESRSIDTSHLEGEENDVANALASEQDALKEQGEILKDLKRGNDTLKRTKDDVVREKRDKTAVVDTIRGKISSALQRHEQQKSKIEKAKKHVDTKTAQYDVFSQKCLKQEGKRDELLEAAKEKTRATVSNWDGEPLKLEHNDTENKLKKAIEAGIVNLAKKKKEANVEGRTIEVVMERYQKAKADYQHSRSEFDGLKKRIEEQKADLKGRQDRFKELRDERTSKIEYHFRKNLEHKSMEGKLHFTHPHNKTHTPGRLDMEVSIDAQSDEACKDVRQLSGGERSFTTFCLLLALGTIIEGPFRIMDEYDVFLDEVTRQVTLDQLCVYSKLPRQRGKQFIIVTPHKLDSVQTDNQVRINKMPDPVRTSATGLQQQVLPFTR